MKKKFFAMIASLILFGCEKPVTPEPKITDHGDGPGVAISVTTNRAPKNVRIWYKFYFPKINTGNEIYHEFIGDQVRVEECDGNFTMTVHILDDDARKLPLCGLDSKLHDLTGVQAGYDFYVDKKKYEGSTPSGQSCPIVGAGKNDDNSFRWEVAIEGVR